MVQGAYCLIVLVLISTFSNLDSCFSQTEKSKPYVRREINEARFGDEGWREFVKSIYELDSNSEADIVGQKNTIRALQTRLISYLENFGNLQGEPMAFHMIGPPGVGKTAIADLVEKLGFKVARFDAQQFVSDRQSLFYSLQEFILYNDLEKGATEPTILIVEELDKLAEVEAQKEFSNEFIGTLNQILSEGKISKGMDTYDISNFFILTTQNIPPSTYESFNKEALRKSVSFFEMTTEHFRKFYDWISRDQGALARTLTRVFRTNTVGRLIANTYLMEPLTDNDFLSLTDKTIKDAIEVSTSESEQRVEVTYDPSLAKYLAKLTTLPATGARNTIMKTNHLVLQLIAFGKRATVPGDNSLDRPRRIHLRYDSKSDSVAVQVEALKRSGKLIVHDKTFTIRTSYEPKNGSFLIPREVVNDVEMPREKSENLIKRVTGKEVRAARFPESTGQVGDVEKKMKKRIFGQEDLISKLSRDLTQYLSRKGVSTTQPSNVVLAGFPGTGKSVSIFEAARVLDIPVIRVNLQNFASDDSTAAAKFIQSVMMEIRRVQNQRKDNKYVLLLEELDKVFEIDPQTRMLVPRPIMGLIKDLLSGGKGEAMSSRTGNNDSRLLQLDIRDGFLAVTMNFAVDLFGFEADPRLTTTEDVLSAWERLSTRVQDLKSVLGKMFLPETVNRILPKTIVVRPLVDSSYRKIIETQVGKVLTERFYDKKGRDIGRIEMELTPDYKQYLFNECVIPSEGGRYTETKAKQILSQDLEEALSKFPREHHFATKPVVITLHFRTGTQTVIASAAVKDRKDIPAQELFNKPVALSFPPMQAKGKMAPFRMLVSVHEFGHAFSALRLGYRFSFATVVPPQEGVGGYVKPSGGNFSALSEISDIYMTIASRAMERIFLSNDPRAPESVLDITPGSSSDIQMATKKLYSLLYELGFNPFGPTISRAAGAKMGSHSFNDLTDEEVQKMGRILREMENYLVEDFLKAHSKDWYIEKITEFARRGGLKESEFYKMVGYSYPGENDVYMADYAKLFETFKQVIQPQKTDIMKAQNTPTSNDQLTQMRRAEKFKNFFVETLKKYYLDNSNSSKTKPPSCGGVLG